MAMDLSGTLFLQEAVIAFLVKAEWKPAGLCGWTHYDYNDDQNQPIVVTYLKAFEITQDWLFPPERPTKKSEPGTPAG